MLSYYDPEFIEKFLWESGFTNFAQNRNDTKYKSVNLATILKLYNIFTCSFMLFYFNFYFILFYVCRIMIFYSAYIYSANSIAKFRWESGFLRLGP